MTEVEKVLLGGGMLRTVAVVSCSAWRGVAFEDDPTDRPADTPGRAGGARSSTGP